MGPRTNGFGEAVRADRVSYWIDSTPATAFAPLEASRDVDVAVVGGGIVGLTTALLVAESGHSVAVLEADRIAAGVSGYTTAKLTAGHGLLYSQLDETTARLYAESQLAAIELVRRRVETHDIRCDLEPRVNVVYADREAEISAIEDEVEAEQRAGLPARFQPDAGLPFPTFAALVLDGQYQFHPRAYLLAAAGLVEQAGARIHEESRVTGITGDGPYELETERATLRAPRVIVATHYPIVEHGFFATRIHPARAYVVAAPLQGGADLDGMFINASATRSLRTARLPDGGRLLLAVGEGHRVGQETDTDARYAALEAFMRDWFDVGETRYRWSTQDPETVDRLPFVGEVEEGSGIFVATGFAGWGMSNGTLAGMLLSDAIAGVENEWSEIYSLERRSLAASLKRFVTENTALAVQQVTGARRAESALDELAPGAGAVFALDGEQVAISRDPDGTPRGVSATCTHMGCTVAWNPAESTWDCPCHGSRFAPDGRVLHGPAVKPLSQVELADLHIPSVEAG